MESTRINIPLEQWLQDNSGINNLLMAAADINGVMRGKSVPVADARKVASGEVRMALSTPTVNIWGNEIKGCSQVDETGDCDITLRPTGRTPYRSVMASDLAIVPADFWQEDNTPLQTSCRQFTRDTQQEFQRRGWQPVVALEIEFYLYDLAEPQPMPPKSPVTGERLFGRECGSLTDLQHFAPLLGDIRDACKAAGIQTTSVLSENSPGMFEINLHHSADLLQAADDLAFLRLISRDIALKHGFGLTFMPKPYADLDGSGQHMHFSILDDKGNNIFDNGTDAGSPLLQHAAAGLLENLNAMVLLCAPHLSSYRRIQPDSYAPTAICWGYDNRSVPVRIPGGAATARRIEYRVAGADANPYLLTSCILMAALYGIDNKLTPPTAAKSDAYDQGFENVLSDMPAAINAFEQSSFIKSTMPALLREAYLNCKKQEYAVFVNQVTQLEIDTFRNRI